MLKDTQTHYGIISKSIHWLSAIAVIGLFTVGYWMVDLTYYSQWYKTAPHLHKSIGILLLILTIFRLQWKVLTPSPEPVASHSTRIQQASKLVHYLIYALMVMIMVSGYLISTADGRGIEVFNLFVVASLGELFVNQEDIAGFIHEWLAYSLIALTSMHAVAALKHHFIDKDSTLKRMI